MMVSVAQTWVTAENWVSSTSLNAVMMAGVFGAAASSLVVSVAVSVPSMGWTIKVVNALQSSKAPFPR